MNKPKLGCRYSTSDRTIEVIAPIEELYFVKSNLWKRATDRLFLRKRQSRYNCHTCRWSTNVRKVEVQIVPTDEDWKALGMEGCSISYVPFKGQLEIHWCPNCRKVVTTFLYSDRKDCLYNDIEEGFVDAYYDNI